ncbi:heterokaryon incompatibility protein-domain-containing protein, partial [Echria macrotheca]
MKDCLQDCNENHATCAKLRQQLLVYRRPKYLLDLGSVHDGQICIIDTKGTRRDDVKYAILSYCWGGKQTCKTTSKNLSQRLRGFPLADLPETIRDAVNVTQTLGLGYLWVDALCIQQDIQRHLIQRELDAMPEFYATAAVVISAACAPHSDAGFLKDRDLRYHEYELPLTVMDEGWSVAGRIRLFERSSQKKREPIDMRVWTEPEKNNALCSFRFESERVAWRCRQTADADSDVDLLPPYADFINACSFDGSMFPSMLPTTPDANDEGNMRQYLQHVRDFSARQCESFGDRLVAFETSARSMATAMGWEESQYKAGLWLKDMQRELQWCRDVDGRNGSADWLRPSTTLVPSWSWASVPSAITWNDLNDLDWGRSYTLRVIKCDVELQSSSRPFSGVKGGSLLVEGYALNVFWDGQEFVHRVRFGGRKRTSSRAREQIASNSTGVPSHVQGGNMGNRTQKRGSPIRSDQLVPLEACGLSISAVWDSLLPPASQDVTCLEILDADGFSSGVILHYIGSGRFQ